MPYEFASSLLNFLASEIIQLVAGQVENHGPSDHRDVMSLAVEYISVHRSVTSSLPDRRADLEILPAL